MKLHVQIIKAKILKDNLTIGTLEPYFIVKLNQNKTYQSKIKKGEGKYPIWNENVTFSYDNEAILFINIYHKLNLVGSLNLYIDQLEKNKTHELSKEILFNEVSNGEILFKIQIENNNYMKEQNTLNNDPINSLNDKRKYSNENYFVSNVIEFNKVKPINYSQMTMGSDWENIAMNNNMRVESYNNQNSYQSLINHGHNLVDNNKNMYLNDINLNNQQLQCNNNNVFSKETNFNNDINNKKQIYD